MAVFVEVHDPKILTSGQGAEFWVLFRANYEHTGRFTPIGNIGFQGQMCLFRADDQQHADDFIETMRNHGAPKTAFKICHNVEGIR